MSINLTLIGQMITFAIFIWFTMTFVWPPLRKAMHDRNKKIADGLANAEKAENELEIARRKANEITRDAKAQATSIIDQANERARRINEQAKEDARESAEKIRAAAEKEIAREKQQARNELKAEFAGSVVMGTEKLIRQHIDEQSNRRLLDEMAEELE